MQPPVILVPGIGDDERKLRMLVRRLQQAGRQPIAISPQPSDGSAPIDTLARLLADAISDALGPDQPLDLFGFSMGGLICRYYLQQLGGLWRTRRFVTLASPHRGTWVAYRYPGRAAARQMRPYSPFSNRSPSLFCGRPWTSPFYRPPTRLCPSVAACACCRPCTARCSTIPTCCARWRPV